MEKGIKIRTDNNYIKGKNFCLIIAIDNYKNGISKLNNCVKDATDIKRLLIDKYQFTEEDSIVLNNDKATRKNILSTLRNLKDRITQNDNLLITFSGHGANIDDVGYWLPTDSVNGEDYNYISSSDLIDRLNAIKCHHLFLIIDACFSGGIFLNTRSDFVRGDEKRPSRYGFSASHSKEVAYDGDKGENSPFAKHLIRKLKSNNRPITLNNLADHVIQKVQEETEGKQTPIFRPLDIKGDDLGQFILYPKHLFYRFEDILQLVEESKFDDAVIELRNYCLESKKLPNGYEFLICGIKNRLHKIKSIEKNTGLYPKEASGDVTFRLNEIVRGMKKYVPTSTNNFADILYLSSTNSIDKAINSLKERFKENSYIYFEAILYLFRLRFIEKEWRQGILDTYEYYDLYCNIIDLFVLFIKNIHENVDGLKDTISLATEFLNKNEITLTIKLLDDFIITHFRKCEEWYLLSMLQNRDIENRHRALLEVSDKQSIYIENNRIIHALDYLLKRLTKKKIHDFFDGKIENSDKEKIIQMHPEIEELILKGEIATLLRILHDDTKNNYVILLNLMYNSVLDKRRNGLIDSYDSYGGLVSISRGLLEFLFFKQYQ